MTIITMTTTIITEIVLMMHMITWDRSAVLRMDGRVCRRQVGAGGDGAVTAGQPRAPLRGGVCGVRVCCREAAPAVTLISSWPREPAGRARHIQPIQHIQHKAAAPACCRLQAQITPATAFCNADFHERVFM